MNPFAMDVRGLVYSAMYTPKEVNEMRRAEWAEQWGMTDNPTQSSPDRGSWLGAVARRVSASVSAVSSLVFQSPSPSPGKVAC